tara:strand:- start:1640 stop:1849 length:210 start_codon:yes stop_codon:yes gene_type:complete
VFCLDGKFQLDFLSENDQSEPPVDINHVPLLSSKVQNIGLGSTIIKLGWSSTALIGNSDIAWKPNILSL